MGEGSQELPCGVAASVDYPFLNDLLDFRFLSFARRTFLNKYLLGAYYVPGMELDSFTWLELHYVMDLEDCVQRSSVCDRFGEQGL